MAFPQICLTKVFYLIGMIGTITLKQLLTTWLVLIVMLLIVFQGRSYVYRIERLSIHNTTLSFKQGIEDAANKISLPIASKGDLAPVFTIFEAIIEEKY